MGRQVIYRVYSDWPASRPLADYDDLDAALDAIEGNPKGNVLAFEKVYIVWQLGRPDSIKVGEFDALGLAAVKVLELMIPPTQREGPYTIYYHGHHNYAIQELDRPLPVCFLRLKGRYFS